MKQFAFTIKGTLHIAYKELAHSHILQYATANGKFAAIRDESKEKCYPEPRANRQLIIHRSHRLFCSQFKSQQHQSQPKQQNSAKSVLYLFVPLSIKNAIASQSYREKHSMGLMTITTQ